MHKSVFEQLQRGITIGGDERVVRGVEVHEPVPSVADPQQQRGAVQRGGERGRAARVGEAGVPDDMDVVAAGGGPRIPCEPRAVGVRGGAVEQEEVSVAGVVGGEQQPQEAVGVARGSREEERERGRGRAGGGDGRGGDRERREAGRRRRRRRQGSGGGGEEVQEQEQEEGSEEEAGERAGVLGEDAGRQGGGRGRRGGLHGWGRGEISGVALSAPRGEGGRGSRSAGKGGDADGGGGKSKVRRVWWAAGALP